MRGNALGTTLRGWRRGWSPERSLDYLDIDLDIGRHPTKSFQPCHSLALWVVFWLLASALASAESPVLPQYGQDKHEGVSSCDGSTCHGSAAPRNDRNIMQNEYSIWVDEDRHNTRAYKILLNNNSIRISRNLGRKRNRIKTLSASTATPIIHHPANVARKIMPSGSTMASAARPATVVPNAICVPTTAEAHTQRISNSACIRPTNPSPGRGSAYRAISEIERSSSTIA